MADTKTTHEHEANERSRRRMLYGSNMVILVLFAIALVVIVNYAAQFRSDDGKIRPFRGDWSTAGVNSLSPATVSLLRDLDAKGQSFEITSLFGASAGTTLDVEQARQIEDVLREYARRSTHIKLYTPQNREELEQKVAERYREETQKYEAALQEFDAKEGAGTKAGLAERLEKFFKGQAPAFLQIAGANRTDEEAVEYAGAFHVSFNTDMPAQIGKIRKSIGKTSDSVLPDWGTVKSEVSSFLGGLRKRLDQMADPAKLEGQLPKPLVEYFKKNNDAYKAIIADIKAYQERLDALPELQIDTVKRDIDRNSLLVFGPKSVKVINKYDIFKSVPDRGSGGQAYTFEGEQAISSSLLAMVRPDKPKVVFVSASAQQRLTTGQFSAVADQLRKNNFDVLEWAPPGPQMSPDAPPPEMTPPAEGKGVVWVVFPPDAPAMPGMPSATGPLVSAVREHMEKGGSALFLAEASNPMMAFGAPDAAGYAFADVVKPFGINVKAEYSVITLRATQRGTQAIPVATFTHYPKHPISNPLESLQTMFSGNQSRFGFVGSPTVVEADKSNAAATVIVQTERSSEIFATKGMPSPETKFDATSDIASPVPVAVASSKGDGDKAQRVVVIGNRFFALNELVEAQGAVTDEDRNIRAIVPMFPGNAELFCNSVYWLSGYENMIAVSAKANVAQRISPMSDTTLMLIRVLVLWLGLPLAALIAGGVVYFMRHR